MLKSYIACSNLSTAATPRNTGLACFAADGQRTCAASTPRKPTTFTSKKKMGGGGGGGMKKQPTVNVVQPCTRTTNTTTQPGRPRQHVHTPQRRKPTLTAGSASRASITKFLEKMAAAARGVKTYSSGSSADRYWLARTMISGRSATRGLSNRRVIDVTRASLPDTPCRVSTPRTDITLRTQPLDVVSGNGYMTRTQNISRSGPQHRPRISARCRAGRKSHHPAHPNRRREPTNFAHRRHQHHHHERLHHHAVMNVPVS